MKTKVGVSMTVTRGPQTWDYTYTMLGFTLTIEGTIIQMIPCLKYPWNLVVYAVLALLTLWLFIDSAWFHDKLVRLKNRYENKGR